jgi:hypothetical protein
MKLSFWQTQLLVFACLTSAALYAADPDDPGFERLFDGKSLKGWYGPTDGFEAADGALTWKEGQGGTIYTRHRLNDFTVRFEFKMSKDANAGLAIRYPGSGDPAYVGMCEIKIRDEADTEVKDARAGNGSAYGLVAGKKGALRPLGEWNAGEITVRGSHIKVVFNAQTVLDSDLEKVTEFMDNHPHPGKDRESGHFGINGDGVPVLFRNLRLKKSANP